MSRVLIGCVDVSKAGISPQHLRGRSEISPCHIAPECRSGNFASSFSASAAPFLSRSSNRPVPRVFSETAFAALRGASDIAKTEEQLTDFIQRKTEPPCPLNDCQAIKRCGVVPSLAAHSLGW